VRREACLDRLTVSKVPQIRGLQQVSERCPSHCGTASKCVVRALCSTLRDQLPVSVLSKHALSHGSDCTGYSALSQALTSLQIPNEAQFFSETNKALQRALPEAYSVARMHPDIHAAERRQEPAVSIYEAGFPCQPFAQQGKQLGAADPRGSLISDAVVQYIRERQPPCFVLENVPTLATRFTAHFKSITASCRAAGYTVNSRILSSESYGLPHHRRRLFIVGVRNPAQVFEWPKALPKSCRPHISDFYDRKPDGSIDRRATNETFATSKTFSRNLALAMKHFSQTSINPAERHYVINLGGVPQPGHHPHFMENKSPCITASRGSSRAFFSTYLRRRLSISELSRLQGADPTNALLCSTSSLSERQKGHLLGNAISVPVLMVIVRQMLISARLASPEAPGYCAPPRSRLQRD
jgi:DNA-cytosine methyltransferase